MNGYKSVSIWVSRVKPVVLNHINHLSTNVSANISFFLLKYSTLHAAKITSKMQVII